MALVLGVVVSGAIVVPAKARLETLTPRDGVRKGDGRFVFVACPGKSDEFTRCNPYNDKEAIFEQAGESITQLTSDNAMKRSVVWSPDLRHFAFSDPALVSSDADCPAYSTPLEGRARRLLEDDGWSCVSPVDWSPGGGWILLNFSYFEGGSNLFRVRPDGTEMERITCIRDPGAGGTAGGFFFEGGKKVVFAASTGGGVHGIYSIRSNGVGRRLLHEVSTFDFDLSPDQSTLAFANEPEGSNGRDVYAMNVDGSNVRRLTSNDASEVGLAFSPDGTKVAFGLTKDLYERPFAISVVDVATGVVTELELPEGVRLAESDFRLVWSPDGTRIAFEAATRQVRREAIYWSDLERGSTGRATDFFPSVSLWGWLPVHSSHHLDPETRAPR